MNNFNGIGRIVKDLEVKTSQGGTAVLNNTVAIHLVIIKQRTIIKQKLHNLLL